jgi:hypothetical protein
LKPLAGLLIFLAAVCGVSASEETGSRTKELYADKCTSCHRLHRPTEYSREKWPTILERMAVKAKLTPEEAEELREYLVSRARP